MNKTNSGPDTLTSWLRRLSGRANGHSLPHEVQPPVYWPTTGWPMSTPEEQGIDSAKFAYATRQDEQVAYRVGLDNVPRLTETGQGTYAATETWTAPDTFTIEYELVGTQTGVNGG